MIKPLKLKNKNKKAQSIFDIFIFIVIVFLMVVGFVLFKFVFHTATVQVQSIQMPTNIINLTDVTDRTFVNLDNGLASLEWIGLAVIIGMLLNILVSNFLIKTHPAFFLLYIGVVVLGIIISAIISNEYQNLASGFLASTFESYKSWDLVMNNLPVIVTVVGFIGGLLLFLGIQRDMGQGGAF